VSRENDVSYNKPAALTSEELALLEIRAKGQFKARPLNREIFKPIENTTIVKPETTKPEEFNLTKPKVAQPTEEPQPRQSFRALPFNKSLFEGIKGRLSVPPPKLTQAIGFNLSTEKRGLLIPRKRLHIEEPHVAFKAKKMPLFQRPSSPTRSTKSTEFRGKLTYTMTN
jgi:hypothetical protein